MAATGPLQESTLVTWTRGDRDLYAAKLDWLPGEGIGDDSAEESLLVLGISRGKAVALGRAFGQLAVVTGRRGGGAQLVSCAVTPRHS